MKSFNPASRQAGAPFGKLRVIEELTHMYTEKHNLSRKAGERHRENPKRKLLVALGDCFVSLAMTNI
jgi:hypothetical protein